MTKEHKNGVTLEETFDGPTQNERAIRDILASPPLQTTPNLPAVIEKPKLTADQARKVIKDWAEKNPKRKQSANNALEALDEIEKLQASGEVTQHGEAIVEGVLKRIEQQAKAKATLETKKPKSRVIGLPAIRAGKPIIKETDFGSLCDMMAYCRPHGSRSERDFILRFLGPLGMFEDGFGNVYKKIGESKTLWSCHTDTVHNVGGRQKMEYTDDKLQLPPKAFSNCLGADDTSGVWLMRKMIIQDIPGLYIFHRGEERGGLGSEWITKNNPDALKGVEMAIGLDRRGFGDVITHQRGMRCCSKDFAADLAVKLGGKYCPDPTGSFTDTANYTDLIPECTNLSVGYDGAHGSSETQDYPFLFKLRDTLCDLDPTTLTINRKAGDREFRQYNNYKSHGEFGWDRWADEGGAYGFVDHSKRGNRRHDKTGGGLVQPPFRGGKTFDGYTSAGHRRDIPIRDGGQLGLPYKDEDGGTAGLDVYDLVRANAHAVARFLEDEGVTVEELYRAIMQKNGYVNR
jgi:hypothetical protein